MVQQALLLLIPISKFNNVQSSMYLMYLFSSTSPPDDEQKLVYKRVLRGGEIPSNGLQKLPSNNRGKSID